jgi:molybdopterin synthase catalytic subunit
MKWPSSPPSAADKAAVLSRDVLDASRAAASVEDPEHGAVVVFEGRVRGSEDGAPITAIAYDAYESMAEEQLSAVAREAEERWDVRAVVLHRLGRVPVNEASLVVAVGAGHRAGAFDACRWIVDEVKKRAPIWKISFEGLP